MPWDGIIRQCPVELWDTILCFHSENHLLNRAFAAAWQKRRFGEVEDEFRRAHEEGVDVKRCRHRLRTLNQEWKTLQEEYQIWRLTMCQEEASRAHWVMGRLMHLRERIVYLREETIRRNRYYMRFRQRVLNRIRYPSLGYNNS